MYFLIRGLLKSGTRITFSLSNLGGSQVNSWESVVFQYVYTLVSSCCEYDKSLKASYWSDFPLLLAYYVFFLAGITGKVFPSASNCSWAVNSHRICFRML